MFFFTDFSCDVIAVLIGHIFTFLFRDWNTSLFWNLFAILIGFLVTLGVLFLHIPDSVNLDALGLRQLLACFWKLLPDFVIVALKTRLPVVNWWGLWIRNNSIFVANVHHPGIVKGNCCIFWWANKCCAAHNMVFSIFLPSSHQKSKKTFENYGKEKCYSQLLVPTQMHFLLKKCWKPILRPAFVECAAPEGRLKYTTLLKKGLAKLWLIYLK